MNFVELNLIICIFCHVRLISFPLRALRIYLCQTQRQKFKSKNFPQERHFPYTSGTRGNHLYTGYLALVKDFFSFSASLTGDWGNEMRIYLQYSQNPISPSHHKRKGVNRRRNERFVLSHKVKVKYNLWQMDFSHNHGLAFTLSTICSSACQCPDDNSGSK